MRRSARIIVVLVLVVLTTGCLESTFKFIVGRMADKNEEEYGPIDKWGARCDHEVLDVTYGAGEPDEQYLVLDVYYNDHKGLNPMVINIHGGAWIVGDKAAINQVFRSKYVANHGYVVFNVNYRMLPEYPIRVQVEDVMAAVIWAKEHAAEYGADPARVGVMGGSAGGHMTAMVAWASGDMFFNPTGRADTKLDSDVQVAVPFYGVFDLERFLNSNQPPFLGAAVRFFNFRKPGADREEIYRHISPQYHVAPNIPPTLFVCGDEDELFQQAVEYEKILRDKGVKTALHAAVGGSHGFDFQYGAEYSQKALEATVAWFDQYLR